MVYLTMEQWKSLEQIKFILGNMCFLSVDDKQFKKFDNKVARLYLYIREKI